MRQYSEWIYIAVLALGVPACSTTGNSTLVSAREATVEVDEDISPAQQERDLILSLLAMTIVRADWQSDSKGRGHNIGSVLSDKKGMPVYWARNAARKLNNGSQHGEVRLIQNFLDCEGIDRYADGYTVYTTLEPCAMCTGLMTLTQVSRVVYVQKDTGYGNAAQALRSIQYPKVFKEATLPTSALKTNLEAGFEAFKRAGSSTSITDYLLTPVAKAIYDRAANELDTFKPSFAENAPILVAARSVAASDLTERYGNAMASLCPPAKQ